MLPSSYRSFLGETCQGPPPDHRPHTCFESVAISLFIRVRSTGNLKTRLGTISDTGRGAAKEGERLSCSHAGSCFATMDLQDSSQDQRVIRDSDAAYQDFERAICDVQAMNQYAWEVYTSYAIICRLRNNALAVHLMDNHDTIASSDEDGKNALRVGLQMKRDMDEYCEIISSVVIPSNPMFRTTILADFLSMKSTVRTFNNDRCNGKLSLFSESYSN